MAGAQKMSGEQIGTIVILVLVLIIVIAVVGLVLYARQRIRKFSRSVFGTPDIIAGLNQAGQEAEGPRSVSAMTRVITPRIKADFPEMNVPEMISRARNVLLSYLRGVTDRNPGCLQEGNSELRNRLENHIGELNSRELKERYDNPHIHQIEIADYRMENGRNVIRFQAALECMFTVRDKDGKLVRGSEQVKSQKKYNVEMIYIQDRSIVENDLDGAIAVNCPNCGAPLSMRGAHKCIYCDAPVIEVNMYAWSFSSVEEVP
jgi:hypothetical protein